MKTRPRRCWGCRARWRPSWCTLMTQTGRHQGEKRRRIHLCPPPRPHQPPLNLQWRYQWQAMGRRQGRRRRRSRVSAVASCDLVTCGGGVPPWNVARKYKNKKDWKLLPLLTALPTSLPVFSFRCIKPLFTFSIFLKPFYFFTLHVCTYMSQC